MSLATHLNNDMTIQMKNKLVSENSDLWKWLENSWGD